MVKASTTKPVGSRKIAAASHRVAAGIANGYLVLCGGRLLDSELQRLRDVDIVISGNAIVDLVERGGGPVEAQRIDVSNRIMHPGLVNAHTHSHGVLGRAMEDQMTLELLIVAGPWIYGGLSLDDIALCAELNSVEMILKGCTTCYDLYLELPLPSLDGMQALASGYARSGMKAIVAPMVMDTLIHQAIPGLAECLPEGLARDLARPTPPGSLLISRLKAIYSQWRHPSLSPAVAPSIPLHCTTQFFLDAIHLADEFGLRVHSHIAESKVQAVASLHRFGKSIVSHLSDIGALTPRFTAAHGVWLSTDDMELLANGGSHIAHNPGANMRLGSGVADVRKMLDLSINVGIGTDGSNCSDNQNMYEAMRLASLVSKSQSPHTRDWISTREVLTAATSGSAALLGMQDQIGRIEFGYRADIVFLDASHPNWIPVNNPVNQLVHVEDGNSVTDVMIDGRFVVRDRQPLGIDLANLARRVQNARERLSSLNKSTKRLSAQLSKIVNRYCPCLAHERLEVNRYLAQPLPDVSSS